MLLAVLAAAGLLALAPALVRRYDATERLVAERAQSTARVLDRTRRPRTVPGRRPIQPPRSATPTVAAPSQSDSPVRVRRDVGRAVWLPVGSGARTAATSAPRTRPVAATPSSRSAPARSRQQVSSRPPVRRSRPVAQSAAIYRRRRVLAGLVLLNVIEVVGVGTVDSGFWTAIAVTGPMLVGYLIHLRNEALADARRQRVESRQAIEIAIAQAEIQAEHARRLAARREALRRAAAARAVAQREAQRLSQRYVDFDQSRRARVRGRQYETGGYDGRVAGF